MALTQRKYFRKLKTQKQQSVKVIATETGNGGGKREEE